MCQQTKKDWIKIGIIAVNIQIRREYLLMRDLIKVEEHSKSSSADRMYLRLKRRGKIKGIIVV